jgi:hypothetical protein
MRNLEKLLSPQEIAAEVATMFVDLEEIINSKKDSPDSYQHLRFHEYDGVIPGQEISLLLLNGGKIELMNDQYPIKPLKLGLVSKSIRMIAPAKKSFDFLKTSFGEKGLSEDALAELSRDCRFESFLLGNLVEYADGIIIPKDGIDEGFTIEAYRNFGKGTEKFPWSGFTHYGYYTDSITSDPQDKDTIRMRSAITQVAQEYITCFKLNQIFNQFTRSRS